MTTFMPAIATTTQGAWPAQLELRFHRTAAGGCKLAYNRHEGPLAVQRPFYPEGEDLAHVYLLHPPGGLVSGDDLRIRLQVGDNAQVLCTTPGAGRLYRARADRKLQQQHALLEVGAGASLEWFPLETIAFNGAHARMTTDVQLAAGARFSGWEITSLGHVANRVRFDDGELAQRLQVFVQGMPAVLERLRLRGSDTAFALGAAALQAQPVSGVFVSGQYEEVVLKQLELAALHAALPPGLQPFCGLTRLGTFITGRYLGQCAGEARAAFTQWWQALRPLLLHREACAPRIWTT